MPEQKHTFCRICEPYCPLVADIDDSGKIVRLSPDPTHPSGGIACHKGLSFLDVHNDPNRLNWPQKRLNPRSEARGRFVDIDWDAAMQEMGDRLRAIRDESGPNAIAFYMGNPWSMSAPMVMMTTDFEDRIGTQMRFNGNTQDTQNKMVAAAEIYGSSEAIMVPDLVNTDYLLCVGTNPKVSRWTTASVPNDSMDVVKRITSRGGKVRFVNPRTTESSTRETGPTLRIKPGTDVYFLAALLHEIDRLGGFDAAQIARYGERAEALKEFVALYPAERVAAVTGIDAEAIREVATGMVAARSAAVYMATGVNQSRQGVLAYWLVEMINFMTGNLGREGGTFKPPGLSKDMSPATGTLSVETSVGAFALPDPIGFGALPAVLLPRLIENGDIRALIVLGGNPLLTIGGEEAMRRAFEKLDMLISIDIYRSATGELSDYVLAATDFLERMDINMNAIGVQIVTPYVQYTDAVTRPAAGRRHGWWICSRLAQAMGLESELDQQPEATDNVPLIEAMLGARGLSIEDMRAAHHHTVLFETELRETLFDWCLKRPNGKIDCCPPKFGEQGLFDRCERIFAELLSEPEGQLKLISLRTRYMHNSWLANTDAFRRGKETVNPLHMCEQDAAAIGLYEGDPVRVSNTHGSIDSEIRIDDDLRSGVVAMSHGYGHAQAYGLDIASRKPGSNCNALMPMGADTYEPLSHMSWLSGVPVDVQKLKAADARRPDR